jgi:D-xylonolactonase
MEPEVVVDLPLVIGENPLWHSDEKKLYWVDIHSGALYSYDPDTGKSQQVYRGTVVGGFTIQEDGGFLLFMENGTIKALKDGKIIPLIGEIPEERGARFNDVIADPEGRVFCGTMPGEDHPAHLYRLEKDGSILKIVDGIGLSNGMGFTLDRKKMYHTDSPNRTIYIYDYDMESGEIENRRVYVSIPENQGSPDGLTVDAEGFVWSARWDGWCLVRYTPDGEEDLRITFPAKKVSSVTFGGEDYTDIYVTTAGGDKRAEEGFAAGALFRLKPGVQGVPEFRSRISL